MIQSALHPAVGGVSCHMTTQHMDGTHFTPEGCIPLRILKAQADRVLARLLWERRPSLSSFSMAGLLESRGMRLAPYAMHRSLRHQQEEMNTIMADNIP